jgi:hypothetical protein
LKEGFSGSTAVDATEELWLSSRLASCNITEVSSTHCTKDPHDPVAPGLQLSSMTHPGFAAAAGQLDEPEDGMCISASTHARDVVVKLSSGSSGTAWTSSE